MEKIELLQSVSIFWDLNENDLGHIADKMVAKHFENGNYIFLEDSDGEQCFFVLEGSVKVTRLSNDGREVILAMLNEATFLERCLFLMVNRALQMLLHWKKQRF